MTLMPSLPIGLIATDIDGTLLRDEGVISQRNLRAIRAAQKKGVVFAIASGRFPENAFVLIQDYGLSCPIIGSNGARVLDENMRDIARHPMDRDAARRVLDILIALGADFFLFSDRSLCTSRTDLVHHSELDYGERIPGLGFAYRRGLDAARSMVETTVYKFYVCNNVPLDPVRRALRDVPRVELTRSGAYNLEVMPVGVNKGRGVVDLAARLGVPMDRVMTLGDEDNDLSMIRAAGSGIAMGNATDAVKQAAFYVTDTNQRDGLAQAIERFAL